MPSTLPALFVGHGNPMNALQLNRYSSAWRDLGIQIGKPKAVLCVSAHWYVPFTAVTAMQRPRTIHDFGGFPKELFATNYPAPGSPELARRVRALLEPVSVDADETWGLDHGAWSILVHLFPDADVPVIQLSIDQRQPAQFHYEIGKLLAPLRDEGVLILGSGNVVHNLEAYAWGRHVAEPYSWAIRFESRARELLEMGDHRPLVEYETLGDDALLSIPTAEHYLPLLYVLGTQKEGEPVRFPVEGVDGGSVSMLAARFG